MESTIIVKAIKELSPDAEFAFSEDDLSTLQWHNDTAPRPTDEEILAHCKVVIKNLEVEKKANAKSKAAILDRLGLTADEAALLLS